MPDLNPRNMAIIKQRDPQLHDALMDIVNSLNNVGQQVSASPVGRTPPPTGHTAISVIGGGSMYDVALTDNSPQYRGKQHFVEYSKDPSFSPNATHRVDLGEAQNIRLALGAGPFHFRSFARYPTSGPSEMIYHPPVHAMSGSEPPMQAGQGLDNGREPFTGSKPPIR